MILNTHPEDRKTMAVAISLALDKPCEYMRIPTYAYRIGAVTVNRDGTTESDDLTVLEQIKPMLIEHGWLDNGPDEQPISTPSENEFEDALAEEISDEAVLVSYQPDQMLDGMMNLVRVLYTKQRLLNRMLQMEDTLYISDRVIAGLDTFGSIEDFVAYLEQMHEDGDLRGLRITNDMVRLIVPFNKNSFDQFNAAGQLIPAIIRFAQNAKRVHTSIQEPEDNEKYMANSWLNRLGFGGPEHKELRRVLMRHLTGYAAFRDEAHMLKHREKLNAVRHAQHEEENKTNE